MGPQRALLWFSLASLGEMYVYLDSFQTRKIKLEFDLGSLSHLRRKMEWGSLGLSGSGCLVDLKVGSELTSAIVCRRHPCSPRSCKLVEGFTISRWVFGSNSHMLWLGRNLGIRTRLQHNLIQISFNYLYRTQKKIANSLNLHSHRLEGARP